MPVVSDPRSADKQRMARLYNHLRNEGLEDKIQGPHLKIQNDRVRVSGQVESQEIRQVVILALGQFEGVTGVDDSLR